MIVGFEEWLLTQSEDFEFDTLGSWVAHLLVEPMVCSVFESV